MIRPSSRRILILSLVFGLLIAGGMTTVSETMGLSALLGAGIGSFNFFLLAYLMEQLASPTAGRLQLALRFVVKYLVLILLIAGAFFLLNVDPLSFALGVGNVVPASLMAGLWPVKEG